jgi:hypothetical protein
MWCTKHSLDIIDIIDVESLEYHLDKIKVEIIGTQDVDHSRVDNSASSLFQSDTLTGNYTKTKTAGWSDSRDGKIQNLTTVNCRIFILKEIFTHTGVSTF